MNISENKLFLSGAILAVRVSITQKNTLTD